MQINCLNHNSQCKYIKKKLLSVDFHDIGHIMFLKKLQVILQKLRIYLREIDIKIYEEGNHLFNFFYELDDRSYFKDSKDIKGFIRLNYIKLSNNMYQISAAAKNTPITVISYINIDSNIFLKNVLHIYNNEIKCRCNIYHQYPF